MDAIDFLNSDEGDLPKTRIGSYPNFLKEILDAYRFKLSRVSPITFVDKVVAAELKRVEENSAAVRDVISLCVRGKRSEAYSRLDNALHSLGAHLHALMPKADMSQFINPMYRFRSAGTSRFLPGDLFHIPFELRDKVKEMRYSVAKLPCLYLGGSTQVCWKELGEPDLASISVSRFQAAKNSNLRILNFGHRLPLFAAWIASQPNDFSGPEKSGPAIVAANVACWPWLAACSVRVPDRLATERPEYLAPQLVLEWITKTHEFDGIRYFSTHYSDYPDDPKTYMNYVFPAKSTSGTTGYCPELCSKFELTEPCSWAHAKAIISSGARRPRYKKRGDPELALEAEFGGAEDGLLSLPVSKLCPK